MTKISNIWDAGQPSAEPPVQKPIKLLRYLNSYGGTHTALSYAYGYENIVRLCGDQNCIVMCWDDNNSGGRDIFLAEWNDGVVDATDEEIKS